MKDVNFFDFGSNLFEHLGCLPKSNLMNNVIRLIPFSNQDDSIDIEVNCRNGYCIRCQLFGVCEDGILVTNTLFNSPFIFNNRELQAIDNHYDFTVCLISFEKIKKYSLEAFCGPVFLVELPDVVFRYGIEKLIEMKDFKHYNIKLEDGKKYPFCAKDIFNA